ncbi:hypothetical protein Pcinc_007466 [Petrolisthes cinctipes]|uniref:Uncharacterized protein n=1 Tax=Petrolisthes cinctipes TaxID=88211 RepID=A0AAE1GB18_PETCI|nr:hypothetical protein Pcinc_007466 [Petrolisthes cinctipes]
MTDDMVQRYAVLPTYYREMAEGGDESMAVLDGASVLLITPGPATIPTYRQKRKQSGLWREAQATCRVFVLEISDGNILAAIRYYLNHSQNGQDIGSQGCGNKFKFRAFGMDDISIFVPFVDLSKMAL